MRCSNLLSAHIPVHRISCHWAMTGPLTLCDDEFRQAVITIQKYYLPFKCHTLSEKSGNWKYHPGTTRSGYRNHGKHVTLILNGLQTTKSSQAKKSICNLPSWQFTNVSLLSLRNSKSFTSNFTNHLLAKPGISIKHMQVVNCKMDLNHSHCVHCGSTATPNKKRTANFIEYGSLTQLHWYRRCKWHHSFKFLLPHGKSTYL